MPPAVLTVGHSNHPPERFLALLARHGVEAVVDIRRFPGSRKHPHFSRDNLAAALPKSGVEYHWLEALGGRRHQQRDDSPNLGLENQAFRNYADYMLTDEFREGVKKLLEVARQKRRAWVSGRGRRGPIRAARDEGGWEGRVSIPLPEGGFSLAGGRERGYSTRFGVTARQGGRGRVPRPRSSTTPAPRHGGAARIVPRVSLHKAAVWASSTAFARRERELPHGFPEAEAPRFRRGRRCD
jgi:hypothetical protein